MKTIAFVAVIIGLFFVAVAGVKQPQPAGIESWIPVHDQQYQYTASTQASQVLQLPAAPRPQLNVDNVFGSITVTGHTGDTVDFKGVRSVRAESEAKLREAENDVRLEIFIDGDTLHMRVNGPFRDAEGNVNWNDIGYIVKFDFELMVPYRTRLSLKTVNEGDIQVTNMDEDFAVRNVNGRITLTDMGGTGSARTVNGPVTARFKWSPAANCDFKTVNGDIILTFPDEPSADFQAKTFNGEILSDFPVVPLSAAPGMGERIEGKYVFEANRFQGFQVGRGGPEIRMETLNGDVVIARAK